jgi:DNA-binding GntR family transcriptional regulator
MAGRGLQELSSATLADRAYDALREAIISGELAPGEKITERGLAERLAVSATPVREALRRLEQDQLVLRSGPRTVQVAALDDDRADEIRMVEGALRAVAARLAATNATAGQLERMGKLLDEADAERTVLQQKTDAGEAVTVEAMQGLLDATRRFHDALNEASSNPVLLRLLRLVDAFRLADQHRKLDSEMRRDETRAMSRRYEQHRAIYDAVRTGEGVEAERLMRAHAQLDVADNAAYNAAEPVG